MTVSTGADVINPTHHVKLSSGATEVGLILCDMNGNPTANGFARNRSGGTIKMYQGEATYDDGEPPWSPQSITDFSGGFGAQIFDTDKTRHWTGVRAYTANGSFEIGPQPVWTGGLYRFWPHHDNWVGSGVGYRWHQLTETNPYIAVKFTTTATTALTRYHFIMRVGGTYAATCVNLGFSIYTDVASEPGALVDADTAGTFTPSVNKFGESQEVVVNVTGKGLTASTDYWLVIKANQAGGTWSVSCPEILCATQHTISGVATGSAAPAWTGITTYKPFYVLHQTVANHKLNFFELKGALYAALLYDNATESSLFLNGDSGVATGGTTTTLTAAAAGHKAVWATNEAIGSVLVLTSGTGSNQPRNFRTITGNAIAAGVTTFTTDLNDPWDIAPAASTQFVIVASNKWTAVTEVDALWNGQKVYDVLAVNQGAYFAHGDTYAMTRLMVYDNAGMWTYDASQEATTSVEAYATILARANDPEGAYIWKARGGFPSKIAKAPVVDCTGTSTAADLVFKAEIGAGDLGTRITNMIEYGEDYGQLHIIKEGDIYKVNLASDDTDYVTRIPISGFQPSKDWRNGRAACVHDTYLYFSWHDTVLRYYRNYLDNIGPNSKDTQMSDNYRGTISALRSYPGMLYASIDGGVDNYSSVIGYNGVGWCNLFTAPDEGHRIQNIYIQSIPGDNVDRLWISCGNTSLWIPISTVPFHHLRMAFNHYNTAWDASIQLGYMFAGRRKLYKYWNSAEFSFNAEGYSNVYLSDLQDTPYYQGMHVWTDTGSRDIDMGFVSIVSQPRVTFTNQDNDTPAKLDAFVFDAITREKQRWINTLTFRIQDSEHDLTGVGYDDYLTYAAKLAQLVAWSETTPTILTMTSSIGVLNGKSVMIDQSGIRLVKIMHKDAKHEEYIMQIQAYEA